MGALEIVSPPIPHQLNHNAAASLRKEFGLETARIFLARLMVWVSSIINRQSVCPFLYRRLSIASVWV